MRPRYNKNVIYFNIKDLDQVPTDVLERVYQIHKESCDADIRPLCVQDCLLAIYIDPESVRPGSKQSESIKAFLTVNIYKDGRYGEIYNVCTDKSYRGKGAMRSIFNAIYADYRFEELWLGVRINNRMLEAVLSLYLRVGFRYDGIKTITPSGKIPGFQFVSLIWYRNNPLKVDKETTQRLVSQIVGDINGRRFVISDTNQRVVYIDSNLTKRFNPDKVFECYRRSNYYGGEVPKSILEPPPNSTLALFIERPPERDIDPSIIFNSPLVNILSTLLILNNNSAYKGEYNGDYIGLIDNLCGRNPSTERIILETLAEDYDNKELWIPISSRWFPNKEFIEKYTDMFVSVGFVPTGIRTITPIGTQTEPTLWFELYPGSDDLNKVRNAGLQMVKDYVTRDWCDVSFSLKSNTIEQARSFLNRDAEFGGILYPVESQDHKYILKLGVKAKGAVKGEGGREEFTINTPGFYITWHTHPNICYIKYGCYIGWPSGIDLGRMIYSYSRGEMSHFLFTDEGTYHLQINYDMTRYLRFLPQECIDRLSYLAKKYFTGFDQYRHSWYSGDIQKCFDTEEESYKCLFVKTEGKKWDIIKFVENVNNTRLRNLLAGNVPDDLRDLVGDIRECMRKYIRPDGAEKMMETPLLFVKFYPYFPGTDIFVNNIRYYTPVINSVCTLPPGENSFFYPEQ